MKEFKYRKIGEHSRVDESLFGTAFERDVLITGKDTVMAMWAEKKQRSCGDVSDTILLHNDELMKMKERKRRMLAREAERRKKEIAKLNNEDSLMDSIRNKALEAKYEQRDEVKKMNQMILHGKVNTIRDTQIEQKRQWKAENEAMEKKLDLIMDIALIQGIHQDEEKELKRQQKLKAEAAMIRSQIAEREAKRQLELEERERERQLLVKQMEALQIEEQKTRDQKEETKRMLMNEINSHNAKFSKEKEERQAERLKEDMAIAEYQREKAQREKELEDRKREMMAAKEKEIAALYAKHEKVMDKQAEMDALRARRAMDERERRERLKETQEKERLGRINAELAEARQKQHRDKVQTLAQMAVADQEEFDRMARVQRESEKAEKKKREEEQLKRHKHAEELRRQIEEHEKAKLQRKREHIEEAIRLKKEQEEDRKTLETIKVIRGVIKSHEE
ncbi:GI11378, related [Neospora caninum Liverpool]|uniref:Cilia- and flagella-associated protein 45 n=1 Tax=Neospora caninum (strain Liverpool) TaxID=572307 RepID=F0VNB3_NEOCL|nr:GI11378, related [Neospora caninum Liverpool]CBZ55209.1 GI11378, related [Neospora caninum Liverpool]CEL69936.1 TPA: GI11378, related [Neospora caninum Liverpool]|eukprot:XP_003885237.1 GI11378, related [Neospora caninum Liverpool]